jgi:hypothetical protein
MSFVCQIQLTRGTAPPFESGEGAASIKAKEGTLEELQCAKASMTQDFTQQGPTSSGDAGPEPPLRPIDPRRNLISD